MCAAPLPAEAVHDAILGAPLPGAVVSFAGIVLRTNERWAALFGRPAASFAGRTLTDALSVSVAELQQRLTDPAAARPLPARANREDGTSVAVELEVIPASNPAEGAGTRGVYVVEARESAGGTGVLPDAAFRAAPVGLGTFDESFRFRRVNAALAALLEVPAEELVGRSYQEFLHPAERTGSEQRVRLARNGAMESGEKERRFVTGKGRTVWLRTAGVRVAGPEVSYFGVFVDVSARYEAEAEQARLQEQVVHAERLRTLGQIAGAIAHEVNNPAAIAIGGVDIARRRVGAALASARTGDIAGVRRHLENLEAALRYCEDGTLRIAQAARRLGSFSSLHGGRVERMDPNDAVRRSIELVRNDIRHRARLVVELGELPRIVAHPDRLIQAIINLLVNAGQAIEGAADDHAITVRTWASDGVVFISVADTGTGMTREVRERLFEPFFTSRAKDRSTGLGLSVVHDVVRQHRGKVEVWTELGRGSRFTLELPLDNGLDTPVAPPVARARRVLVIDDEPFLVAVLTEILEEEHEVVSATSGRDALVLLAQDTEFDVVLCDLMMPGIDGIEVHGFLLKHAPALAARTVFCTGGAFTARAESYLAESGVPVLAKPFTAEDVFRSLSEAAAGVQQEK